MISALPRWVVKVIKDLMMRAKISSRNCSTVYSSCVVVSIGYTSNLDPLNPSRDLIMDPKEINREEINS